MPPSSNPGHSTCEPEGWILEPGPGSHPQLPEPRGPQRCCIVCRSALQPTADRKPQTGQIDKVGTTVTRSRMGADWQIGAKVAKEPQLVRASCILLLVTLSPAVYTVYWVRGYSDGGPHGRTDTSTVVL